MMKVDKSSDLGQHYDAFVKAARGEGHVWVRDD